MAALPCPQCDTPLPAAGGPEHAGLAFCSSLRRYRYRLREDDAAAHQPKRRAPARRVELGAEELGVGPIAVRSLELLLRLAGSVIGVWVVTGIATLVAVGFVLGAFAEVSFAVGTTDPWEWLAVAGVVMVVVLADLTRFATLVRLADARLRGEQLGFFAALADGVLALFRLFGALIVLVPVTLLGLAAFVFPGLYAATTYGVALQVVVCEHADVGDALRRSADLTKGRRGGVLGVLVCLVLGQLVLLAQPWLWGRAWQDTGIYVAGGLVVFVSALSAVMMAVLYHWTVEAPPCEGSSDGWERNTDGDAHPAGRRP